MMIHSLTAPTVDQVLATDANLNGDAVSYGNEVGLRSAIHYAVHFTEEHGYPLGICGHSSDLPHKRFYGDDEVQEGQVGKRKARKSGPQSIIMQSPCKAQKSGFNDGLRRFFSAENPALRRGIGPGNWSVTLALPVQLQSPPFSWSRQFSNRSTV